MSTSWSQRTDPDIVARRAGGRRRYNAVRQLLATFRRAKVARLLRFDLTRAEIARRLNVHPSTISRDVSRLLRDGSVKRCQHCGRPVGEAIILEAEAMRVLDQLDREVSVGTEPGGRGLDD